MEIPPSLKDCTHSIAVTTPLRQATQSNIRAFAPLWLNGKRCSLYLAGLCTDLHNVIAAALDQFPVVGDHENGSAVPCFASQPFRNEAHILPVKAAGGLIEYQYPAAGKDGAGNGKPLLLPAGQGGRVRIPVVSHFKDSGIITLLAS